MVSRNTKNRLIFLWYHLDIWYIFGGRKLRYEVTICRFAIKHPQRQFPATKIQGVHKVLNTFQKFIPKKTKVDKIIWIFAK